MKNPHVAAIGKLNLTGNIIPSIWWQRLRLESGAPDFTGVMILAEIVNSKETELQRNYQSFADQFGLSKKQVREAMQRLVERKLITTDFRTITQHGIVLNNVLFIGINESEIEILGELK